SHNDLASCTARLAEAAFAAGWTYVIEKPVDRGECGTVHFRMRFGEHASIWLGPDMRALVAATSPVKVTIAYGSWPARREAARLAWAQCSHPQHCRRARGRSSDGTSESARPVAYPPVFNAAVIGVLFNEIAISGSRVQAACGGVEESVLHETVMEARALNQQAAGEFLASAG
ncbi:MAG: hypothetical protein SGPRY_012191, partial [Prymnesium sp.]